MVFLVDKVFDVDDKTFEELRAHIDGRIKRSCSALTRDLRKDILDSLFNYFPRSLFDLCICVCSSDDYVSRIIRLPSKNVIFLNEKQLLFMEQLLYYSIANAGPIFPFTTFSYLWSLQYCKKGQLTVASALSQLTFSAIQKYSEKYGNRKNIPLFAQGKEYAYTLKEFEHDVLPTFTRLVVLGHEIGHHICLSSELSPLRNYVGEWVGRITDGMDRAETISFFRENIAPPDVRLLFNCNAFTVQEELLTEFPNNATDEHVKNARHRAAEELFCDLIGFILLTPLVEKTGINFDTVCEIFFKLHELIDAISSVQNIVGQLINRRENFTLRFSSTRLALRRQYIIPLLADLVATDGILPPSVRKFWRRPIHDHSPLLTHTTALEWAGTRANLPALLLRGGVSLGFFRSRREKVPQTKVELDAKYGEEAGAMGFLLRPYKDDVLESYFIEKNLVRLAADTTLIGFASAAKSAAECLFHRDTLLINGTDLIDRFKTGVEITDIIGFPGRCVEEETLLDPARLRNG